jgi:hypothetical protein
MRVSNINLDELKKSDATCMRNGVRTCQLSEGVCPLGRREVEHTDLTLLICSGGFVPCFSKASRLLCRVL